MKRTLIIFILLVAAVCGAKAQMTAASALRAMPWMFIPELSHDSLLDMIDYYENGTPRDMSTQLGSKASLLELSENHATLKINEVETYDFYILPYGNKSLIMVLTHLLVPEADVSVNLASSRWDILDPDDFFKRPALSDYLKPQYRKQIKSIEEKLPFLTIDGTYDPSDCSLIFTPTLGDYVNVEDRETIEQALLPSIKYRWNGKNFKLVK